MLLRNINTIIRLVILSFMSFMLISYLAESNTVAKDNNTIQITKGTGKDGLLKWFKNNFKYPPFLKTFMEKREQQIDLCIEKKISCKWIMGSAITNSKKGYIVTFKEDKFTVEEFPAGRESEYGMKEKDIFFKTE
jgi:hypothetical protein